MKSYLVNSMLDGRNITDASSLSFVRNRMGWKCSHKRKFTSECGGEGETNIWKLERNFCCCTIAQSADNYQPLFKLRFASFAVRAGAAGWKSNTVLCLKTWVFAKASVFITPRKGGLVLSWHSARCLIDSVPLQPWANHLIFYPLFFSQSRWFWFYFLEEAKDIKCSGD